jgi:hypothetical protein
LSKHQRPNYFGFSLIHRTPRKATNKPTCRSRSGTLPRSPFLDNFLDRRQRLGTISSFIMHYSD